MNTFNVEDDAKKPWLDLSREKSMNRYKSFREWCRVNDTTIFSKSLLLAYLLHYRRERCYNQSVAKNTITEVPWKIATYLNLCNLKVYTGHTFRRTSATLFANTGLKVLMLNERHRG
ncbi:hypothetical protein QE152_g30708 [Popillia japonica]|uniref:Uncharacterized protein n=1 Tax=Popillia japonica TaxID=7064 RepID=A0AAW1JDD7_POPJA